MQFFQNTAEWLMCLKIERRTEKNNTSSFLKLSTTLILENCSGAGRRERGEIAEGGSHSLRIYHVPEL